MKIFKNKISKLSFFLAISFFATQISPALAAVTPGKEQDSFDAQSQQREKMAEIEKPAKESSVKFAASQQEADQMAAQEDEQESDEKVPAADDEEDEAAAPRTHHTQQMSSTDDAIVIPIRGKIDVATLRALAETLKNIDEDEGEVEVNFQIAIAKKPGVFPSTSSAPRAMSATEAFDQGVPTRTPEQEKQMKDLARAEKAAAKKSQEPVEELREEVPFFVQSIEVTGNTVVKSAEIEPLLTEYQGRQLKLSDAKELADKITKLYRAKGYVTCRAYIPPQNIESKKLEIKVLEGKVGKVKIRGNKYFKKRVLKRYLQPLKNQVLEFGELQKELTRLNMHPDREVKAVIVPGQEVGTSDLLLDVKDQRPIHINADVNNFGTELTGEERYGVSIRHSNLLGQDDIFATRFQVGQEVFAVGLQHALPVGPYGTMAGWTFNYTDVGVGGQFSALDIAGQAYTGSLFVQHPLYDGKNVDLTWTGSFESKTIDNTILGAPSSKDELRMLHTGANLDLIDPYGRTFVNNDFTFGLPWFGASDKNDIRLSRQQSGGSFFIYNGALNRIHPVYDSTYLYLKGAVQSSPDPLVSAEQFDIGGVYSVRGYPQSDYLGDYGTSGTAEIRVPFYFIPRDYKIPHTNEVLWNKINLVGFVDAGYASLRRPAVGESPSRSYVGAGAGVRMDLPNNIQARFEWAAPVGGDDPIDGSNGQFYFSFASDLI